MNRTLRIGTRGSALALAQTGTVAAALERAGARVEIVTVSTPGDRSSAPIAEIGIGVFTSALRDALAHGEVDVAVHSFKDLPTAPDARLSLAAVPRREDPRDALVARDGLTLGELPPGSTVGTGSPRRAAQLRALGLGLEVVSIRGNVDTRLRKVADGELDAVVLARAGLARLGRLDAITEVLDPLQMLPAPAQGALAVECRVDDVDVEHLLQSTLDDPASRAAVTAERAMLAALEAGCSAPVGALAEVVEDLDESAAGAVRSVLRLSLRGVAATPDDELLRASTTGETTAAEQLGRALAAELLDLGAAVLGGPGE
ncbi:hydroxymethylbilane synthase [Streptoalloteichus tenebrarius]|uniref:Porphobilinogen deaminase n=1 Tax=Streptoalloteichus tenebrarius (strain ATCC 17920 / DSM 40477 / JCM 4838 / CBS 697.72 / NBRC 16177 / NCIMB 11028 / NRRL B-12390 / A12253. 1 / ISP 5477) TaxID=1933 RepID=A0ABT1I1Q7_STRSD|nr:hydroxymethylbilane synthase [Streptoalloteichus tenebrarius]MCP2261723.1 hydroxymethylbilane synthase [Streptoalloteichus tenebrarius]BFF02435.1 hydroxymethylbilane synthase [Streptoalloteichus tenebrarius]